MLRQSGRWTVHSPTGWVGDRDAIIRWAVPDHSAPYAVAIADSEAGVDGSGFTLAIGLSDTGPTSAGPRDVVVVLDRSGSMDYQIGATAESTSMDLARRAAARLVDSLGGDDRFAVVAFDTEITTPWNGWRQATDPNSFAAMRFIAATDARGDTELPEAIQQGLARFCPTTGRDQIMIVITDALVAAGDATLYTAASAGDVTLHGILIGHAANAGLLDRLADATGGTSVVVNDAARLDQVLDGIRSRITPPVLSSLRVTDWDLGQVTPRHADLHAGVPLVLAGRIDAIPEEVTIEGTSPDGVVRLLRAPVSVVSNPAVHSAWARARVRDLEDLRVTASRETGKIAPPSAEQIVAHSITHRVLSRYTAFVAVDKEGGRVDSPASRLLTQPLPAPPMSNTVCYSMAPAMAPIDAMSKPSVLRKRSARVSEPVSYMASDAYEGLVSLATPGWRTLMRGEALPGDTGVELSSLLSGLTSGLCGTQEFLSTVSSVLIAIGSPLALQLLELFIDMVAALDAGECSSPEEFWESI